MPTTYVSPVKIQYKIQLEKIRQDSREQSPMSEYRSKSYSIGKMQIEPYYGVSNDFRFNSVSSYRSSAQPPQPWELPQKLNKGKSTSGSTSKSWGLNDPELQRKNRVARYKAYAVEDQVKGSFRKSFRWLKDRYTQMVHGWW